MNRHDSAYLTVFEGPDGSGKTTVAKKYAEAMGARYVHFSALPRVNDGLGRIYVEAMLPALLGYQHVVFDRSWLSEVPYGTAFREGHDRLGDASRRMLERLALRCGAVVVSCDPGWEVIKRNFLARKHLEMLENDNQLFAVHRAYCEQRTHLPMLHYDYTSPSHTFDALIDEIADQRTPPHPVGYASAGNWGAKVVIVGESFSEVKNQDAFYQWPFASFSKAGCSQWLATQLDRANASERDLLWVNADQDLSHFRQGRTYIGLGRIAEAALFASLNAVPAPILQAPHPQFFRRFNDGAAYPLTTMLKELLA